MKCRDFEEPYDFDEFLILEKKVAVKFGDVRSKLVEKAFVSILELKEQKRLDKVEVEEQAEWAVEISTCGSQCAGNASEMNKLKEGAQRIHRTCLNLLRYKVVD